MNLIKVIILIFVFVNSRAQSNEKLILSFIKNLKIDGVDTIAVFETTLPGSNMRTDSCKYVGFYKFFEIFWLKNGNIYLKPFSCCAEYKIIKDNSIEIFQFYNKNILFIKKDYEGLLHLKKRNHEFFYNVKMYLNEDLVNLNFTDSDLTQENELLNTNKSIEFMALYFKAIQRNMFVLLKYFNLKSKRGK